MYKNCCVVTIRKNCPYAHKTAHKIATHLLSLSLGAFLSCPLLGLLLCLLELTLHHTSKPAVPVDVHQVTVMMTDTSAYMHFQVVPEAGKHIIGQGSLLTSTIIRSVVFQVLRFVTRSKRL